MVNKTSQAKHKRSTKGCSECRIKRKACDELKPNCSRCKIKGVKCIYKVNLRFRDDSSNKQIAFGREGVWSKSKASIQTSEDLSKMAFNLAYLHKTNFKGNLHFINTSNTLYDFTMTNLSKNYFSMTFNTQIGDSSATQYALSYFKDNVSTIFNPLSLEGDGTLDFGSIVQYVNHGCIHLFYLLIAIGSCHLAKSNKYWQLQAKIYRAAAHQEFIKRTSSDTKTSEILLYTLLLCLFDLANKCDDHWSIRINTAKWLIENNNESNVDDYTVENRILRFSDDFFSYQETMGRTACRNTSIFSIEDWENNDLMIPWMGCKKSLVSILSDITDLSFEKRNINVHSNEFQGMVSKLEMKLNNYNVSTGNWLFNIGCICKINATKIYLNCSLLNYTPNSSLIKELVKHLANDLKTLIIYNGVNWHFLLWPLFIMCCEIDPYDEDCEYLRKLSLEMFEILKEKNLG
ncbi:Transcriptional activator protein [Wickerhamomyces ciferrii]|uniref:Transcriptional activator protein n=1 Tax=Wickerhamomyces ciferrii (strain ATCC 14091 / BCRC 22168 / CBS 111 / JCM 3599 / NBRC 0793 / NRRL Y-1031 F-60-10) TaxID=1206466 RepID=K0KGQ0_WICCF|nr:Transcriptional activator protein [Wickerhamomyces ciferrii]CCH44335.1 Transcriptional activator protein [Wickerhamomyces ciferrii]